MELKILLTKQIADNSGICYDTPELLDNLYRIWWQNIRHNGARHLRLTEQGFYHASRFLKFYQIDLSISIRINNNTIIWLDKFIDCPYYLTDKSIFVSSEKMAVQLMLFAGDLNKFGSAKHKNLKSH